MRPVFVADTGPLHYLVLIHASVLPPRLFERVLIPEIVAAELSQPSTPAVVRTWLSAAPPWLERRSVTAAGTFPRRLGAGERAAITLAQTTNASLLLMDDRAGSVAARARGLETLGTIGILARGARHDLVDLAEMFDRLKRTNFRYQPEMLDALLARHRKQE
jgi:predicted nucleic acid-binding protein